MKTEFEYLKFKKVQDKPKTSVWHIFNKKSDFILGHVAWYPSWRQYCALFAAETVFSSGCLDDISEFVTELNSQHKKNKLTEVQK